MALNKMSFVHAIQCARPSYAINGILAILAFALFWVKHRWCWARGKKAHHHDAPKCLTTEHFSAPPSHIILPWHHADSWAKIKACLRHHKRSPPKTASALDSMLRELLAFQCGDTFATTEFPALRWLNDERRFFSTALPHMIETVLDLAETALSKRNIQFLDHRNQPSLSINPLEAHALLCLCFFGLMPLRHRKHRDAVGGGEMNFTCLFAMPVFGAAGQKLRCFASYFVTRAQWSREGIEPPIDLVLNSTILDGREAPLVLPELVADRTRPIEDNHTALQVDFANKLVGGGVLGWGSVQEEIRFSICPELLVARIVTRELQDGEAVAVRGALQYASYDGYKDTFRFMGPTAICTEPCPPPFGSSARAVAVAAMDATDFSKMPASQYESAWVERELTKAAAGFSVQFKGHASPTEVASGNWGCGVFGGDEELKLLIQWLAAGLAGKTRLTYHCFGNEALAMKVDYFATLSKSEFPPNRIVVSHALQHVGMCDHFCNSSSFVGERIRHAIDYAAEQYHTNLNEICESGSTLEKVEVEVC